MSVTPREVLSIVPFAIPIKSGWLALSKPGSPIRIGVEGPSEEEAVALFAKRLQEWATFASSGQ